jgi:hypothetical protein
MKTRLRFILLAILTLGLGACSREPEMTLKDTDRSGFKVGQEWSYKTRPGEEQSTFVVVKVEEAGGSGIIVHISLKGLKVKNVKDPEKPSGTISHMPFTEEALKRSVLRVVNEHATLPAFESGYADWRKAFDSGRGGVFDATVAESVGIVEEMANKP